MIHVYRLDRVNIRPNASSLFLRSAAADSPGNTQIPTYFCLGLWARKISRYLRQARLAVYVAVSTGVYTSAFAGGPVNRL